MSPRGKPGLIHESLVRQIAAFHGASTRGFGKALRKLAEEDDEETVEELRGFMRGMLPDAYRFDRQDKNVTINIWEVEITSPLSDEKMRDYTWLWFHCDCLGWDFHLYGVDRYGRENEYDLVTFYYHALLPASVARMGAARGETEGESDV